MSWLAMVASWRCNPCLIRDNAMAAALKANHGFPTRPSAKKKASDQEFARWQTRNPKIDILRSIPNQIMQILNTICMPQNVDYNFSNFAKFVSSSRSLVAEML